MATASAGIAVQANYGTEEVFGRRPHAVRAIDAAMQWLHKQYPAKFAANVAVRARVSTRAVEAWIAKDAAKRTTMSAEAFVELLMSEDGAGVLDAMMRSLPARERPHWWLRHENTARLAQIEKLQAAQDEEIKQLRLSLLK